MYAEWKGRFYPSDVAASKRFAYYAAYFDTVELNSTFYRLPTTETVAKWKASAPDGFVYAVKIGAFGSHRMKLRDPQRWFGNHVDRFRALGEALGPSLLQLPPRWHRDVPRLEAFLDTVRACAGVPIRVAVELRDPSWIDDTVFECLERHNAALVLHDLIERHPWRLTADWTYLRFHGPDAVHCPYAGAYGQARLRRVAERLAPWIADGRDVYAYFNNDIDAAAPTDARALRSLVTQVLTR